MKRFDKMAMRVAFQVLTAKERPTDEFAGAFFDIRQRVKALKEKLSQEALVALQKDLESDLKDAGYEVVSVKMSLGQYRGSKFVTSAKLGIKVKSDKQAMEIAQHLQKFSPKFNLKGYNKESGIAEYNIR